jgi:hypothetical protein
MGEPPENPVHLDKPVLSEVEGLRATGEGLYLIKDLPFMLSPSKHESSPMKPLL